MSSRARYGVVRKVLLRLEAALDLCWVTYKVEREPWEWARERLRPASGRVDRTAVVEIEKAAHSAAGLLPFTVLCVPVTVTAMRMSRRRGLAAAPEWTVPGLRGDVGHVRVSRG